MSTFFNQTGYLYVRYPAEVANIKKCQLQVALVNEGQYKAYLATGGHAASGHQYLAHFMPKVYGTS